MADWWDVKQRWRRRLTRGRGQLRDRWESWQVRRQAAREARRARMEVAKDTLVEQALARAVLDKSSKELRDALLLEVWERHREELQAQALEAIRAEHAQALEDQRERQRDALAKAKAQLEHDADILVEQGIRDGMAEATLDYEDRIAALRQQRNQAREDRDTASHLLLELVRQLLGPKPVYLHSHGITELDQHRLNTVLVKHGVRLRSKRTASERQVQTRLDLTRIESRSVFWLEPCAVGARPDDEDDEPETPAAEIPALPPVAAPPPEVGFEARGPLA